MNAVLRSLAGWLDDPQHIALLASALAALIAVASRPIWRITRTVVTIAHEGGHALVALAARRRLAGIRLHSNTSGVTVSSGPPRGPGVVFTLLAGYPTPSLLGLGGAALIAAGYTQPVLWIAAGLLVATLVVVRNPYGVFAVLVTGAAVVAVSYYASPPWQAGFAAALVWFLLFGGLRAAAELQRARAHGRAPRSDADQLGWLTGVPAVGWVALFMLTCAAALAVGGWWMLLP